MWWHHTFVGFWETSNSKNWKRVQETTNPPSVRNLWLDMPRLLVRLLARNHCIFGSFLHQNLRPLSFQQCKPTNKTITKLVLRHHLWWYFTTETKSINETKDQDLTPGKLLFRAKNRILEKFKKKTYLAFFQTIETITLSIYLKILSCNVHSF